MKRSSCGSLAALLVLCMAVSWSCGGGGSPSPPPGIQMGGSIQGNPLSLSGQASTSAGESSIGSQDGAAADARFDNPVGIARLGAFLYLADTGNHTIRRVVISTGETTTLAGTAGSSGSADGTGAAARFRFPSGITTDGTSLFVTDSGNHTIRRIVVATGVVTTLAGTAGSSGSADGAAFAASFNTPYGIATDGAYLYVADSGNHTIRRVAIGTGSVTTLAGSAGAPGSDDGIGAAARFNTPRGVATDGANLYVADSGNHTIRQAVIVTGAVTTLAGTAGSSGSADGTGAAARFFNPGGVDTDGVFVYVADSSNDTVRRVATGTGAVTTVAGTALSPGSADGTGAAARFDGPGGIASDGANLYVADSLNHTIRQVAIATGTVATLAGITDSNGSVNGIGTAARFHDPRSVTTDGTNLYVADSSNDTIRKIVIATGAVTTLAGSAGLDGSADGTGAAARFDNPYGITTDGANLFVADTFNHTIRRVVIATGAVATLAGAAGSSGSADGEGAAARFSFPRGITTDGTNLYVADSSNNTIRKIVIATGSVATLAGTAGSSGSADGTGPAARFNDPSGITTDGTNLFVADSGNGTIRKVVISTGAATTLAGTAGSDGSADGTGPAARFNEPSGIATDGTNLFVADTGNSTIRRIVISTGAVTTPAGTAGSEGSADGAAATFRAPSGVTTDGTSLYVADTGNNEIRRIE